MVRRLILSVAVSSVVLLGVSALGQVADRPASATVEPIEDAGLVGDGIGPFVHGVDNVGVVLRSAPDRENLHLNIGAVKRGMANRYLCVDLTRPVPGSTDAGEVCADMYLFTYDAPEPPFRLTDMPLDSPRFKSMSIRWTSARGTQTLAFGFKDGQPAGTMVSVSRVGVDAWRLEVPEGATARLFKFDNPKAGEQVLGDYYVPLSIVFRLR
jgi:hypothetical protein